MVLAITTSFPWSIVGIAMVMWLTSNLMSHGWMLDNSSCLRKPAKANKQVAARHMSPKKPFLVASLAIALHISVVNGSFIFTELANVLLSPSSTAKGMPSGMAGHIESRAFTASVYWAFEPYVSPRNCNNMGYSCWEYL